MRPRARRGTLSAFDDRALPGQQALVKRPERSSSVRASCAPVTTRPERIRAGWSGVVSAWLSGNRLSMRCRAPLPKLRVVGSSPIARFVWDSPELCWVVGLVTVQPLPGVNEHDVRKWKTLSESASVSPCGARVVRPYAARIASLAWHAASRRSSSSRFGTRLPRPRQREGTASAQSRRRPENCATAGLTSMTESAGTFARRAAAKIASGDGAS